MKFMRRQIWFHTLIYFFRLNTFNYVDICDLGISTVMNDLITFSDDANWNLDKTRRIRTINLDILSKCRLDLLLVFTLCFWCLLVLTEDDFTLTVPKSGWCLYRFVFFTVKLWSVLHLCNTVNVGMRLGVHLEVWHLGNRKIKFWNAIHCFWIVKIHKWLHLRFNRVWRNRTFIPNPLRLEAIVSRLSLG